MPVGASPETGDAGYVVITAARNAARTMDAVITAVADQDETPTRWVVASDGSRDGTADIVRDRATTLPWITLLEIDRDGPASFVAKAAALRAAYRAAADVPHTMVGNLDSDVVVPPEYYARCRAAFAREPRLGITGGVIVEAVAGHRTPQRSARHSVAGGIQTFRRACWDQVGQGYLALEGGGEDAVAEVLARARGYDVVALGDLEAEHLGPVLGGRRSRVRARAARGILHRQLGHRPWFQLASAASRITEPPAVVGSLATLAGYGWATVRRVPCSPPPEIVARIRAEHSARVRSRLSGRAAERA
jgi:glycosyltransferase involved in cell wall biosynthesis